MQYATFNANGELSEYAIHKTVMDWARYNKSLAGYILHFPSEGKRSISFGARLKSLGMRKGVADLLIAMPRHGYHGAWIELKADGGKLSKEQQAFLDDMKGMGYFTQATFGLDAALEIIQWYCLEDNPL